MPIQIGNLGGLQLDLLVKVNLLLSDDIQFLDLFIDNLLTLLESGIDFFNLVLDLLDLILSIFNHLVTFLNLALQVIHKLSLLSLLEILVEEILSLEK